MIRSQKAVPVSFLLCPPLDGACVRSQPGFWTSRRAKGLHCLSPWPLPSKLQRRDRSASTEREGKRNSQCHLQFAVQELRANLATTGTACVHTHVCIGTPVCHRQAVLQQPTSLHAQLQLSTSCFLSRGKQVLSKANPSCHLPHPTARLQNQILSVHLLPL